MSTELAMLAALRNCNETASAEPAVTVEAIVHHVAPLHGVDCAALLWLWLEQLDAGTRARAELASERAELEHERAGEA